MNAAFEGASQRSRGKGHPDRDHRSVPNSEPRELDESTSSAASSCVDVEHDDSLATREHLYPGPLRMLFWESTAQCNLSCKHCRRMDVAQGPARGQLTTQEAKDLLAAAATIGNPVIVFSGGEPLMRNDWQQLADYAGAMRLPTALATNGTLIDSPTAGRIAAAGFRRVAVSIDGADAQTHDAFRGAQGAFARALAGIELLRGVEQAVQINATIATHNMDQLDQLYCLSKSVGAEALHLFLLVPVGCGAKISPSDRLSAERCEEALKWICDKQAQGGLELRATCAPHYRRVAAERNFGVGGRTSRGCLAGISVVFVSHLGQVYPCGYLPVSCGSVRDQSLAEIWRNSRVLSELRDFSNLRGKCGRCNYKTICGGCRARAYGQTGSYLEAETCCIYEPTGGPDHPTEPASV